MTLIPDQVYLWLDHPGTVMRGGWDADPSRKNIHFVKAEAVASTLADKDKEITRLRRELDDIKAAPTLTPADLADALGCFWNAALGQAHSQQEGHAFASIMAEGMQAVANRLGEGKA